MRPSCVRPGALHEPGDGGPARWKFESDRTFGGFIFELGAAYPFIVTQTGILGSLDLPLSHESGSNSFRFIVYSDSSNEPGTVLDEATANDLFPTIPVDDPPRPVTSVAFTGGAQLLLGTTYWLAVLPGEDSTTGVWFNVVGTGTSVRGFTNNSLTSDGNDINWTVQTVGELGGAFQINAIPEPSTYAAILGGVALLFVIVRRMRQTRLA